MHIFRLFGLFVIIPLISVGLCAQPNGRYPIHRKDNSRHLSNVANSQNVKNNATDSPLPLVTFPAINTIPDNATHSSLGTSGPASISPRSSAFDSLPHHPHPLHLNVHISNSTRTDNFLQPNFRYSSVGRSGWSGGVFLDILNLSWLSTLLWKAISSYAIVSIINLLLAPLVKKFGLNGPYWETSINLGNKDEEEKHSLFNFGPNVKKFRLSFGTNSKDDMKHEDDGHHGQHHGQQPPHGWGWGHQSQSPHPGHLNQPGQVGYNPYAHGPGWLSYDQAAAGIPYMDKYSMKAQKKAQKFTKKAQKYAQKASHYAAKAQAAKLAIKPLYANGFIHPGAATVPGIPAYGWGR